jgi:hypothetical protein
MNKNDFSLTDEELLAVRNVVSEKLNDVSTTEEDSDVLESAQAKLDAIIATRLGDRSNEQ